MMKFFVSQFPSIYNIFFICVTIFNIIVTTFPILFAAFLYKVKKTFRTKNVWSGFFNIKKRCLNPVEIFVS